MSTIKKVTTNYSLRIPVFDAPGWGREMERNFEIVDSVMFLLSNFGSVKGLWLNGTAYISGDRVIDPDNGQIFQAFVDHTSASSGTFAQDRAANPTYWEATTNTVQNRGAWATATTYNVNDFVMDNHKFGVVVTGYTSGVSYDADVVNGNIITLIDLTDDYNDVTNAAIYISTMETAINALYAIRTDITNLASISTDVSAVSAIRTDVTTVAGIDSDVTTVAAISADVQTLAIISADIALLASISAAISAVALNETDISTVADHITNVDTVAGSIADVGTVATNILSVNTVSTDITDVNNVATNMSDINAVADELPSIVVKANLDGTNIEAPEFRANLGLDNIGLFIKATKREVAFTKTGAFAVSIKADTIIEVDGEIYTFSSATAVTMPGSPVVGDYAIWIKPNGDLVASDSFSSPPVAYSRLIGGFHYAPGGNATGYNTGGDTTPAINEYSIWDQKFRPSCPDPRGMALVAGSFWCDIYLLGVDHHINGTSRYNVTIADGSSPPKIPTMFGGNGSTAYSTMNWWEAAEVMMSHGKQLLDYAEFAAAMYGTTEGSGGGTDPVSTILRAAYTSKWGIMLATGNLWVWGRDFGGPFAAASWSNTAGGRGQVYNQSNVARFGGDWGRSAEAGSRASGWGNLPSGSDADASARGRSDHLCYE